MRIIKIILSIIVVLSISNAITAQATLSPVLSKKLKKGNTGFIKVNLILNQQANLDSLQQVFKHDNTTSQIRAKITLAYLHKIADESQKGILGYLHKNKNFVDDIQCYWIVNIITLKAKPNIIYELAQRKGISAIQTDEHRYFCYEPVASKSDSKKNIAEAESGLYAINAPAMWRLGYTGRNRIALGVDTGVKKNHPAIADRFIGNYRPLNQAWFGYNNPTPEDVALSSFHGTHTIGTVLGLDKNTNDTIGVAFNAYWMASDPIVTSLSDVRPLDVVLRSFEWALNSDGNINTVSDMPDVITNSWGWDGFYDYAECDVPEAQAIFAAETAGIGIIFSAGNEGPNATTIGQPANLAPGLLSVFSVGAVNGHSATLPIADFSSRGPTTCVEQSEDYSRWVKPEVVAPGVNVRSSQNDDSYGQLSGTSMASPHVAGAFLLLKEAFPFLSGQDILGALYNSAIDLGDDGEDNTYGKGMIDVKAAFDYLSENHTPEEPVDNSYDIAIKEVGNLPFGYTFNQSVSPVVVVKNLGEQEVVGINISTTVNSNTENYFFEDATIPAGEEKSFELGATPIQEGKTQIKIAIDLTIDSSEADMINNFTYVNIEMPKNIGLPFIEHFDTTKFNFSNTLFTLVNHNADYTWVVDTAGGLPESINSVRLDFTKMKKRNDQYDDLVSPLLSIPETDEAISMRFKYAYARRIANLFKDSLLVLVSSDLGISWNDTIFAKGGEGLSTVDTDMGSNRFIPTHEDEWQSLQFDLSRFKGEKILISFRTVNDNGSNLYLDDIMVFEGLNPAAIKTVNNNNVKVNIFPNPVSESLQIVFNQPVQKGSISILNSLGKVVYFGNIAHKYYFVEIGVGHLDKGLYFLKFAQKNSIVVKKVIKN